MNSNERAGPRATLPLVRCAVYTRKSTEEGLEQEFNSLDAQREAGEAYVRIESPKGELGFYIVSDGGPTPYRWHVRSPSFINLSVLKEMVLGRSLSDAIVVLGSIDINVGEVDR